jgi:2'-5' RNA ligase
LAYNYFTRFIAAWWEMQARIRRLFFALWPDDEIRHQLDEIARQYRPEKSRAIPVVNLHATLIFLGPQTEELLPDIQSAASSITGQSFTLVSQQIQVWRKSRVMCLCPDQVPDELKALHYQLQQALNNAGIKTEDRKYRPHVTLARKVNHPAGPDRLTAPHLWPVKGFSLIESVSSAKGVRYRELSSWPLYG